MQLRHLPNVITAFRALFCLLLVHYFFRNHYSNALWAFFFAVTTDFLDGYAARRLKSVTRLGSLMDPLMDRLFSFTVLSLLMAYDSCPAWFLGLHIATSLLQMAAWIAVDLPTDTLRAPFRPLPLGRWNTALQCFWMGLMFADLCLKEVRIGPLVALGGYVGLAILQITVFFHYVAQAYPSLARLFLPQVAETA